MNETPKDKPVRRVRRGSTRPTMVQVAEAADVSVFTVSAVVNGTSVVSETLRRRVQEAIARTGYQRNTLARSLKTGQSMTVGLTLGNITNPFYTDVASSIQQALYRAGYAVMLCCNDRSATLQEEQVGLMRDRMVDGMIMSPTGKDDQLRAALEQLRIPVVLIDRALEGYDCDSVLLDNRAAVGDAMRHLIGLGHRRIGMISGAFDTYTGSERLAGYREALAQGGLPYEPELVQVGNFRSDDAYAATKRLMAERPPTALFSANNQMVIGAMKALRDLGFDCPRDVSVVGLDDFPWADAFQPQLTTVAQPVAEFGERAAELLLDRLSGREEGPPRHLVLKGTLQVRQSCGAYLRGIGKSVAI